MQQRVVRLLSWTLMLWSHGVRCVTGSFAMWYQWSTPGLLELVIRREEEGLLSVLVVALASSTAAAVTHALLAKNII